MVLLLRQLYLYFTKDPEKYIIFQGGVQLLPGGIEMKISIETHIRTCYFPRWGGVLTPYSPSGSAHWQCNHNGTTLITVPLLTIIVRH